MKRAVYILVLLAIVVCSGADARDLLRPRGDVNCDWELNIADINALIDVIVAGTPYHSFYTYDHDINGDKEINLADLNLLVDAIMGGELSPMPVYSGTLPVLFINTEGYQDIVSKEEYLQAAGGLTTWAMGISNLLAHPNNP